MSTLVKMDVTKNLGELMEKVILTGDLAKLDPIDRVKYYMKTCESLGMNPLTKPLDLINLNGKLTLYPNRTGTDQLRAIHKVSLAITDRKKEGDAYIVTARARTPDGREDESTGVVTVTGLRGDNLSNAYMKAETKAKRRVTLSIVGLGWLDESEVSSIKGAQTYKFNLETGEIVDGGNPLSPSQNSNGANPGENSTVSNKSKQKIAGHLLAHIIRISALEKQLGMTHDQLKARLTQLGLPPSLKLMTEEQLKQVVLMLEDMRIAQTFAEKEPGSDTDEDTFDEFNQTQQPWEENHG